MKATVKIRRADLVKLNLYLFPRLRSNWSFAGFLSLSAFIVVLVTKRPDSSYGISTAVLVAVLGGFLATLVCMAVALLMISLRSKESNGILGVHRFELSAEGLRESTAVNETLQRWPAVQTIARSPIALYIGIIDSLYYVIPRRGFASEQEYDAFCKKATEYWLEGRDGVPAKLAR